MRGKEAASRADRVAGMERAEDEVHLTRLTAAQVSLSLALSLALSLFLSLSLSLSLSRSFSLCGCMYIRMHRCVCVCVCVCLCVCLCLCLCVHACESDKVTRKRWQHEVRMLQVEKAKLTELTDVLKRKLAQVSDVSYVNAMCRLYHTKTHVGIKVGFCGKRAHPPPPLRCIPRLSGPGSLM